MTKTSKTKTRRRKRHGFIFFKLRGHGEPHEHAIRDDGCGIWARAHDGVLMPLASVSQFKGTPMDAARLLNMDLVEGSVVLPTAELQAMAEEWEAEATVLAANMDKCFDQLAHLASQALAKAQTALDGGYTGVALKRAQQAVQELAQLEEIQVAMGLQSEEG